MKRQNNYLPTLLIFGTLLFTACAGMKIPEAESPDAQTYTTYCSLCHGLPHPQRHDFTGWQPMVRLMEKHMHDRDMTPLADEEREAILRYLEKHAKATK